MTTALAWEHKDDFDIFCSTACRREIELRLFSSDTRRRERGWERMNAGVQGVFQILEEVYPYLTIVQSVLLSGTSVRFWCCTYM